MGLRDRILNAEDDRLETVHVPEWDVTVGVKAMTLKEQRAFIAAVQDPDKSINRDRYAPQLLLRTVVDPDTLEPVFEPADADVLERKNAAAVSRILSVASRLAGLGVDEDDEVTSLDETLNAGSS